MALTSAQKASIRLYLGFSDMSRSTPSHWRLESAMTALSADGETIVTGLLTSLAVVETDLDTVQGASRAGIVSVDNGGVVWASSGSSAQSSVTARGRRLVHRLALTLGVEPFADVFGAGPTSGAVALG